MTIRRMPGVITNVIDISPTAREVTLALSEPLGFIPGAFVNVFMSDSGTRTRRAYSISSDPKNQKNISLSIHKGSIGGMSERFWESDIQRVPIEIMGPLGINTENKIKHSRIFLFSFGIGVSVTKGLLHSLVRRKDVTEITVLTASRSEEEILYKNFFLDVALHDARVKVGFVVSKPKDDSYPMKGHIRDYIAKMNFENSTVYLCGSKVACDSLRAAIEAQTMAAPQFLVEAFD